MAKKKKKTQRKRRFPFFRLVVLEAVCVLLAALFRADVVEVVRIDLPLRDLPQSFEGVTILFVSDIHMTALCPPEKVNTLMNQLKKVRADLLILGGDYTGNDTFGRMLAQGNGEPYGAREMAFREEFFRNLADFDAPLGKYAVAGDMDNAMEPNAGISLSDAAELGGVELLRDESVRVERNDQNIVLVGVDEWRTGLHDVITPAQNIRSWDCAIVISHNPEAVPQLIGRVGDDGGNWMDAALTGHTLGGLIRIGGRELFNPLSADKRFSSGWHLIGGAKVLVSQGLNGNSLPVRLGTAPQVFLITLKRMK